MIIVLIHWRIKPDQSSIDDFLKFWCEEASIEDRSDLIGEFLSESEKISDFPYITWHLDAESFGNFKSFVNVGFWNNDSAFHDQVAKNFNDDKPMKPFEAYRRRRLVITPNSWRVGDAPLPAIRSHSANVK